MEHMYNCSNKFGKKNDFTYQLRLRDQEHERGSLHLRQTSDQP